MNIADRISLASQVCEWKPLLHRFRVSARPNESKKVAFIGESPHTDEVKSANSPEDRYPLAGDSGKNVTRTLAEAGVVSNSLIGQPIGKLVNRNVVDWLTIVNVAEVPLDSTVYQQLVANGEVLLDSLESPELTDWLNLMYSFEAIRSRPKVKKRRNCFVRSVERCIIRDFDCRVRGAIDHNTELVVLLGNVAQAYYKRLDQQNSASAMCALHPSFNSSGSNGWQMPKDVCTTLRHILNLNG